MKKKGISSLKIFSLALFLKKKKNRNLCSILKMNSYKKIDILLKNFHDLQMKIEVVQKDLKVINELQEIISLI